MIRRQSYILCAAMLALCLGTIGCHTVNSVQRAEARATPNVVHDKRIVTDSDLKDRANVRQIIEARVSGLLKVQAEIVNTTLTRQRFNYRFEWIDQNGMHVNSHQMFGWKPVSLAGRESIMISGIAPTPKVVDFRLKLLQASR